MNPDLGWMIVVAMMITCALYSQFLTGLRLDDRPPPEGRVSRLLSDLDFANYPRSAYPRVAVYWVLYALLCVGLVLFAFRR